MIKIIRNEERSIYAKPELRVKHVFQMCETDRRYYQLQSWLICSALSRRFNIYIFDQITILFKFICNCGDGTDETSICCELRVWACVCVCAVPQRSIILVAHMECVMCCVSHTFVESNRFCILAPKYDYFCF